MSRTSPLYDLQRIDQQRDHALRQLARVEAALGRSPAVVAARAAHDDAAATLARVEQALAASQAERHGLRDRIEREEAALYGGRGVAARELEAQKANVDAHRRQLAALDDGALALMLERDAAQAEADAAAAALAAAVAKAAGNDAQLREAHGKLSAGLDALAPRRERARAAVAADDLALYDRLRADPKRNGVAVAALVGDACGGCGRGLTSAEAQRAAAERTQCPACARVLHA